MSRITPWECQPIAWPFFPENEKKKTLGQNVAFQFQAKKKN